MPTRPLKNCGAPACPNLVAGGYCDDHRNMGYQRDVGSRERAKVYASIRWRGLRRQVLREQPWCATLGCNNLATDVDHIQPLAQAGEPYDRANLQALCARCHGLKTRQENYGFKA